MNIGSEMINEHVYIAVERPPEYIGPYSPMLYEEYERRVQEYKENGDGKITPQALSYIKEQVFGPGAENADYTTIIGEDTEIKGYAPLNLTPVLIATGIVLLVAWSQLK